MSIHLIVSSHPSEHSCTWQQQKVDQHHPAPFRQAISQIWPGKGTQQGVEFLQKVLEGKKSLHKTGLQEKKS